MQKVKQNKQSSDLLFKHRMSSQNWSNVIYFGSMSTANGLIVLLKIRLYLFIDVVKIFI